MMRRLIAAAIRARADVLMLREDIQKLAAISRGDARFTSAIQTRRDAETVKEGEYEAVIELLATMHIWPGTQLQAEAELASEDVASAKAGNVTLEEQMHSLQEQVEELSAAVSTANAQREREEGQNRHDEHAPSSTSAVHPRQETGIDSSAIIQDVEQRIAALEVMLDDMTNNLAEHKNEYMDELSFLREDRMAQQKREEKLRKEIRDLRKANAQLNSQIEEVSLLLYAILCSLTPLVDNYVRSISDGIHDPGAEYDAGRCQRASGNSTTPAASHRRDVDGSDTAKGQNTRQNANPANYRGITGKRTGNG